MDSTMESTINLIEELMYVLDQDDDEVLLVHLCRKRDDIKWKVENQRALSTALECVSEAHYQLKQTEGINYKEALESLTYAANEIQKLLGLN